MAKLKYSYSDDTCSTARLNISYIGEKPKVKISYPPRTKRRRAPTLLFSFVIALLIYCLCSLFIMVYIELVYRPHVLGLNQSEREYQDCKQDYQDNYNHITSNLCYISATNDTLIHDLDSLSLHPSAIMPILKESAWNIIPFAVLWFLIWLAGHRYMKRNWAKIEVRFGDWLGEDYFLRTFTEVPGCRYVEIPLFHNMKLDYKATKEFSKFLTNVEIKECPYKSIKLKKKKGKVYRKYYPNETYWYARFYFSHIPKTGKLEVMFR